MSSEPLTMLWLTLVPLFSATSTTDDLMVDWYRRRKSARSSSPSACVVRRLTSSTLFLAGCREGADQLGGYSVDNPCRPFIRCSSPGADLRGAQRSLHPPRSISGAPRLYSSAIAFDRYFRSSTARPGGRFRAPAWAPAYWLLAGRDNQPRACGGRSLYERLGIEPRKAWADEAVLPARSGPQSGDHPRQEASQRQQPPGRP